MLYPELDTPALIIDRAIMLDNLRRMQQQADAQGVALRPHTKTHKMSRFAALQVGMGARGIAVAKTQEAEVMAANGQTDIFIANEIVGAHKLKRIRALASRISISFGLDSIEQAIQVEAAFADSDAPARVLVEIEVGENRSGIIEEDDFRALLTFLRGCPHIALEGVFSHDGHSYGAATLEEGLEISLVSQRRTLRFAAIAREMGFAAPTVSIGSTPSLMHGYPILEGVTEIRPGTYIFMDAAQAGNFGSLSRCAATVLTTIISRPTSERVITDVGAKGLTMQVRTKGLCATKGLGLVKNHPGVVINQVYDEHAILYNASFRESVRVGERIEIIPNHICPVVNLHEYAYLVEDGTVVERIPVDCRGKLG